MRARTDDGVEVATFDIPARLDALELVGPTRALATTIPGASVVSVAAGGPSPQFGNPEAWIGARGAFLRDAGESKGVR